MKTAEEKANDFVYEVIQDVDVALYGDSLDRMQSSIIRLLKDQDRDTRHACAEAVLDLDNIEIEGCFDSDYIEATTAHNVIMNTKAV